MNVYDSVRVSGLLINQKYHAVDNINNADIVIINTCHIREKATAKLYSQLGRINKIKQKKQTKGSDLIIVVMGCVAKAEGKNIFKRAPYVDIVLSSQTYHKLLDILNETINAKSKGKKTKAMDLSLSGVEKFDHLPDINRSDYSAFISIQEGCNKCCTYCVVPFTRGREVSRPVFSILSEVKNAAQTGAKEIFLLGQNVDAYHGMDQNKNEWNMGQLVKAIAEIKGVERIRYTTSYPTEMHKDLMQVHKNEPKLMPFINLPIQAGSNKVLKKMNRRYTREQYLKIIDELRTYRPDIQISSDFIVGFPGETDADFEDTMDIVKKVGFIQSYSFKYSKRPNTPAYKLPDQVPEDVKAKRLEVLQSLLKEQQTEFNHSCIGKVFDVLFTKPGKHKGEILGRSPYMQPVIVKVPELAKVNDFIGNIYNVEIKSSAPLSLIGEIA